VELAPDTSLSEPQRTHLFGLAQNLVVYFFVIDGSYLGIVDSGQSLDVIELPLSALTFVLGVSNYWRRRFYVANGRIVLEAGVFSRSVQRVEIADVRTVSLRTPLLLRWLDLTELTLTESSGRSKLTLAPLSRDTAMAIERLVEPQVGPKSAHEGRLRQSNDGSNGDDQHHDDQHDVASQTKDGPEVHAALGGSRLATFELRRSDVLKLGLVQFVAAAALATVPLVFLARWNRLAALAVASLALFIFVSSIVRRLSFRLAIFEGHLRLLEGVLTEESDAIPLESIQEFRVGRDPIRRLLGLEKVEHRTSGSSIEMSGPLAAAWPLGDWRDIATHVVPGLDVDEGMLQPISPRSVGRLRMRLSVGAIAWLGLMVALTPWWTLAPSALVSLAAIWWVPKRRLLRYGIARSETQLLVRHGILHERVRIVPFSRVESVYVRQSLGQRRRSLATLWLSAAGDSVVVQLPDLDADEAASWLRFLSQESHRRTEAVNQPFAGASDTGVRPIDPATRFVFAAAAAAQLIVSAGILAISVWLLGRFDVYQPSSSVVVGLALGLFSVWLLSAVATAIRFRTTRWRASSEWVQTEDNVLAVQTLSLVVRRGVLSHENTSRPFDRKFGLNRVSLRTVGGGSPDLDMIGLTDRDVLDLLGEEAIVTGSGDHNNAQEHE